MRLNQHCLLNHNFIGMSILYIKFYKLLTLPVTTCSTGDLDQIKHLNNAVAHLAKREQGRLQPNVPRRSIERPLPAPRPLMEPLLNCRICGKNNHATDACWIRCRSCNGRHRTLDCRKSTTKPSRPLTKFSSTFSF